MKDTSELGAPMVLSRNHLKAVGEKNRINY